MVTMFSDQLPAVCVDKVQIEQVVINLMMNAADSMGSIAPDRRIILLTTTPAGQEMIAVAVTDSGPGIQKDALTTIFKPFFTTKRSGLGIGLSLSRSIIESHGGHIRAENNPDRGATIYFDLPVFTEEHKVREVRIDERPGR